jgi:hypothetical protein
MRRSGVTRLPEQARNEAADDVSRGLAPQEGDLRPTTYRTKGPDTGGRMAVSV